VVKVGELYTEANSCRHTPAKFNYLSIARFPCELRQHDFLVLPGVAVEDVEVNTESNDERAAVGDELSQRR